MRPLAELPARVRARVTALFTDIDGTLTSDGKLLPTTYSAMWRAAEAGIAIIPVTGRTAGWADGFAHHWPVRALVAENGGVILEPPARPGAAWTRRFARPKRGLAADRARLLAAAREVERRVPGAQLATDALYGEVDLAIDYNEEVHLGEAAAGQIEAILRARGLTAVRSSVHVNFWIGRWNKLTACRRVIRDVLHADPDELARYVYLGDSLNDEPLFAGFPHSIGVANVRDVADRLSTPPRWVTRAREGAGFQELVRALLAARRTRR